MQMNSGFDGPLSNLNDVDVETFADLCIWAEMNDGNILDYPHEAFHFCGFYADYCTYHKWSSVMASLLLPDLQRDYEL